MWSQYGGQYVVCGNEEFGPGQHPVCGLSLLGGSGFLGLYRMFGFSNVLWPRRIGILLSPIDDIINWQKYRIPPFQILFRYFFFYSDYF